MPSDVALANFSRLFVHGFKGVLSLRLAALSLVLGLMVAAPAAARAQIQPTVWIPTTGDFLVDGNWTYGAPGIGDLKTAFFVVDNSGTAELSGYSEVSGGSIGSQSGQASTMSILNGGNLELIRKDGEFGAYGVLYVGKEGAGTLNIATGGQVSSVDLYAGDTAGSPGTVSVQGGSLTLSGTLYAGAGMGAVGTVTVQSGALTSNQIYAGDNGAGTITVNSSGTVNSASAVLGNSAGGIGYANVAGGTWTNTGDFYIGGTGQGNLHMSDGGTLEVEGTAYVSYNAGSQGIATIDDGQWSVGNWLNIGENSRGSVVVNEGGTITTQLITVSGDSSVGESTLEVNGGTLEAGQIAGLSNGSVTFTGGTLRFTQDNAGYFAGFDAGDVTLNGQVTFDTQQYHVATGAILAGNARLTKAGGGRLGLSAANSYSGGTYLQAGEILINNGGALGTGDFEMDTAELRATADATLALPNIMINADHVGTFSTAADTTLTLDPTTFSLGEDAMFRVGSEGNTGVVVFAADAATAASPGTGTISVGFGTLRAGNDQLTALASQVEKVFIVSGATLDLNDQASGGSMNALFGEGTLFSGTQSSTTVAVRSGNFAGMMYGTGSLVKTGAGTLTLSGSQILAGGTTVSEGTLLISGTAYNVAVNSGGTLGGTGSVDVITLNGGVLTPGESVGTLSAESLVWVDGVLEYELGASSLLSDHLSLSAVLDGEGSSYLFRFIDQGAVIGGTYDLISFQTSTIAINLFGVANADGFAGDFFYEDNVLRFTVSSVPEPGTIALLAIALLSAVLVRRGTCRTRWVALPGRVLALWTQAR